MRLRKPCISLDIWKIHKQGKIRDSPNLLDLNHDIKCLISGQTVEEIAPLNRNHNLGISFSTILLVSLIFQPDSSVDQLVVSS